MAFTLWDYAQLSRAPLVNGVTDVLRKESRLLDILQVDTTGTLEVKFQRTKTLPTVTWRKIGDSYTESKAVTEPLSEAIKFLGGYVDVPKELAEAKDQIVDQRTYQSQMFSKSMAYSFQDKFINGNYADTGTDELVGLWYRLQKDITTQNLLAASGGLDISPDATSLTTNFNTFIDQLDAAIDMCDMHSCDVIFVNSTLRKRINSGLRQLGLFATSKDSFGRKITTYGEGGPEIIDIGGLADQSTQIILNTELADGTALTGGASTSAYLIKLSKSQDDGYLRGWQFAPMEVIDKGLLESHVAYRTVVDWGLGIHFVNPRSITRLYGIIAA